MADLSLVTNYLVKWVINPLFWLIIISIFIVGVFVILIIRKKRRLQYEGMEITEYGVNTNVKCGWFGIVSYLKGLWWSGREVMKTKDNEIINDFSEEDFKLINGKRGVVFYRDPVSFGLYPISKVTVKGKEALANIPPASYVDAAIDIYNDTTKETSDWKEKVIQFVAWALVVVFSLVAIIVIVQYVKNAQTEAADLLIQAGTKGAEACKEVCREAVNIAVNKAGGGAP